MLAGRPTPQTSRGLTVQLIGSDTLGADIDGEVHHEISIPFISSWSSVNSRITLLAMVDGDLFPDVGRTDESHSGGIPTQCIVIELVPRMFGLLLYPIPTGLQELQGAAYATVSL